MSTPDAKRARPHQSKPHRVVRAQEPPAETPAESNSIVPHDAAFLEPDERHGRISEAAYYLAERRGFDPGYELDDWLAAESEVERASATHTAAFSQ
jgi:DUF2934 family protein